MLRSLTYYWRVHLGVLLSASVATAVLTGALVVGDSVRGSLRSLALERLGSTDQALLSDRFFSEQLAAELQNEGSAAVPVILLKGSISHGRTDSRASGIQVHGVNAAFAALFPDDDEQAAVLVEQLFDQTPIAERAAENPPEAESRSRKSSSDGLPAIVINAALKRELAVDVGDPLLLSLARPTPIHREFVFGDRRSNQQLLTRRFRVAGVLHDSGVGRFGLQPNQHLPLNAFVPLDELQRLLHSDSGASRRRSPSGPPESGRSNTSLVNGILLASRDANSSTHSGPGAGTDAHAHWQEALKASVRLDDSGLELVQGFGHLRLQSSEFVLKSDLVAGALTAAASLGIPAQPILTHLANRISAPLQDRSHAIPYSTIAAFDPVEGLPALTLVDGSPAPKLHGREVLLNDWAARDLGVSIGDSMEVTYFAMGSGQQLVTLSVRFRLRGITSMMGPGADAALTPTFPGVQSASNMAEWDAPFPLDFGRLRSQDEAYWDIYGAAPKAFISLAVGQELWSSRFGDATSIRFATSGTDPAVLSAQLRSAIKPYAAPWVLQPVRERVLAAATGATDFAGLFFGFSLFLIASAALLVAMVFRMGVERRADEIGLLLAVGHSLASVRWRFLREGLLLAFLGSSCGVAAGLLYGWIMLAGLNTWWLAAVGTPFLHLHVSAGTLPLGCALSLTVVTGAVVLAVRSASNRSVRGLLSRPAELCESGLSCWRRALAIGGIALGAILVPVGALLPDSHGVIAFFVSGAMWLIGGLGAFSIWLRRYRDRTFDHHGMVATPSGANLTRWRLGISNSSRHLGRSTLSAGLVATACFLILSVGANRRTELEPGDWQQPASGTGGYGLLAESDVPLLRDLNDANARFDFGFSDAEEGLMLESVVHPLKLRPGEDASCLNLYLPQQPRLLGVPNELIKRGGFSFHQVAEHAPGESPWSLLNEELPSGAIPAIGDYNSMRWIMHLKLGDEMTLQNAAGLDVRLQLVGLLQSSIFQSELLISAARFEQYFPQQEGYGYFLIDPGTNPPGSLATLLERRLSAYGFDASSTAEKLAAYAVVENTYLSTFQLLGSLGLILGTVGLGVVLMKNVADRLGELATMRAFGFRGRTLAALLLLENGFLLSLGMAIGTVGAMVAVAPHLWLHAGTVPWLPLALTLAVVFLVGLGSAAAALYWSLRIPLLPILKSD